jgi:RNA polymerase sigma-70 factor (ECF subfamily)
MRPRTRTPEEQFELQERQQMVLDMLQSLPEDQRAALLLREQEQLSYREIAEVLSVSESKVKVDIFRARTALRDKWSRKTQAYSARAH